ncbi:MAG: ACT domain-containing protein, partial [Clostridiales bacterium]|nr:ACT domain-containing protein [Clostridiales bacterium]
DDVSVRFSKCCSPVPGDEIVGYVTRGRGVSIHRTDCVNLMNMSEMEKTRLIDAEWQEGAGESEQSSYLAEIKIYCNDRAGLLVDITKVFTEKGVNITAINSKTNKQGVATITLSFYAKGRDQIREFVEKIRLIDNVIDIERAAG